MNPIVWVSSLPHELAVFLLSMIPITEFQASIPIGIEVYKLPVWEVWILAVVGDVVPVFFLLKIIPKVYNWLLRQPLIGKLFLRKVEKDRDAFAHKYAKYGMIALLMFIALPFPLTGSWTASLVAFLFEIPYKKAIWYIFLGACIAGTIVTLLTLFADTTIRMLFAR